MNALRREIMRHAWTMTKFRLQLAMRNRAFFFFGILIPLAFLFFFAAVFARSGGPAVAYVLAAVLAASVMGSFWGLSMQLVIFREQGILRRFRLTPVGAVTMLVSSVLANLILVFPGVAVEIVLARFVLHMDRWGNLLSILVLAGLGAAAFASLGLVVASVTNSMMETQVINQILWMSFILISGIAVPLPVLPGWLQNVALFLPATYLVTGLQKALLSLTPLSALIPEILSLAGSALIALFVSVQIFRWEPEEKLPSRARAWAAAALIPFLLLGAWESSLGQRRAEARSIFHSIQERPATGAPQTPK